jgi:hypothetical protein
MGIFECIPENPAVDDTMIRTFAVLAIHPAPI